jgi:hypothetical protein
MHQLLSACYFTLLLLHVSATVCHPQGARLGLLSYMSNGFLVDKIVCIMWLCVYHVAACRPPHDIHTTTYYTQFYQPKTQVDM